MKNRSTNLKNSSLPPRLVNENENGIRIKVYIQGHMIGAGKMELFHLLAVETLLPQLSNLILTKRLFLRGNIYDSNE